MQNTLKIQFFLITTHAMFKYTDMRRLTTGIRSEKCVVKRFSRRANAYLHKPR